MLPVGWGMISSLQPSCFTVPFRCIPIDYCKATEHQNETPHSLAHPLTPWDRISSNLLRRKGRAKKMHWLYLALRASKTMPVHKGSGFYNCMNSYYKDAQNCCKIRVRSKPPFQVKKWPMNHLEQLWSFFVWWLSTFSQNFKVCCGCRSRGSWCECVNAPQSF